MLVPSKRGEIRAGSGYEGQQPFVLACSLTKVAKMP